MTNQEIISKLKDELKKLIIDRGFRWSEGYEYDHIPKWIFDLREVILSSQGLKLSTLLLYEKIKDIEFDLIGGPSLAAEPLVASLILHSYQNGKHISGFIVRKQPNNFGLRKRVEGPIKKGSKVVLVDDILNNGIKMSASIKALIEEGCIIVKILSLIDFFAGRSKFEEMDYDADSIFNLKDFGLEGRVTYKYIKQLKLKDIEKNNKDLEESLWLNKLLDEEIDFYLSSDVFVLAIRGGSIYLVQKDTKTIKWKLELGESIIRPVIFYDRVGVAAVNSGLNLSALFFISLDEGKVINYLRIRDKIFSGPSIYKDYILFGSGNGKLFCIDKKNQKILWEFKGNGAIKRSPTIDKLANLIYICSSEGDLYALDFQGSIIWKKHFGSISNILSNDEEKLIICNDREIIFCINKHKGHLYWFFECMNKVKDVKILDGHVWISIFRGRLILLDLGTGKILDSYKVSNEDIIEIIKEENNRIFRLGNGKYYTIE